MMSPYIADPSPLRTAPCELYLVIFSPKILIKNKWKLNRDTKAQLLQVKPKVIKIIEYGNLK